MQNAIYRTLLDIAAGMDYLHSSNVLHGDLKVGLPDLFCPTSLVSSCLQHHEDCSVTESADSETYSHQLGMLCLCTHGAHCSQGTAFRSCACPALLCAPAIAPTGCSALCCNLLCWCTPASPVKQGTLACLHVERPCAERQFACVIAQVLQEPCASTNQLCIAAGNQHPVTCLGDR